MTKYFALESVTILVFVMRDKSRANDNVADNFEQIFNHYSKDTIRRTL